MFGELLALVLGQTAAEALRNSKAPRSTFLDGNTDALSGATSALLGSFGLLFGMGAALISILGDPGASVGAIAAISILGFGGSYFGSFFGLRAPHVTSRFLGMARYAVVVSRAGMVMSVVSLVIVAARIAI